MNGTLQAHLLNERDGATVEPIACPLARLFKEDATARPTCATFAAYDDGERVCPHLHRLVEWDNPGKPISFGHLHFRAQQYGRKQVRCAVICTASKVPAAPGVWQ